MIRAIVPPDTHLQRQQADGFLIETAGLLALSLDFDDTLAAVAQIAVRSLADFCIIDIAEDGRFERVQVAHADPAHAPLTQELLRFPLDRQRPHLSLTVLETGRPMLVPEVTDDLLASTTQGPEHLRILRALRPRSLMVVPLLARDRVIGAAMFVSSQRTYDADDLALAGKIGRLAGLEMDNARHYRAARQALEARDRILGIVAHDLRNPLNTIMMSAELLHDVPLDPSKRDRQLEVIIASAGRMNRLIQDLLNVAAIEAGRLPLHREPHPAEMLAREATDLAAPRAAAKRLLLRFVQAGDIPRICVDSDRLLQVLANVIDNAIKFTPEGGSIEVRVAAADRAVLFAVSDTGPGIPPEHFPFLFQSFWQAPGRKLEGTGLGLAIARGIVEAHGGNIRAESVPGHGSTVYFTIPVVPDVAQEQSRLVQGSAIGESDSCAQGAVR